MKSILFVRVHSFHDPTKKKIITQRAKSVLYLTGFYLKTFKPFSFPTNLLLKNNRQNNYLLG